MGREDISKFDGQRKRYSGTFERFGKKGGYHSSFATTIILKDIRDVSEDKIVTGHLWFNLTKGFSKLSLVPGDRIEFDARVKEYVKGYFGHREEVYKPYGIDYKLSYPTKIIKIQPELHLSKLREEYEQREIEYMKKQKQREQEEKQRRERYLEATKEGSCNFVRANLIVNTALKGEDFVRYFSPNGVYQLVEKILRNQTNIRKIMREMVPLGWSAYKKYAKRIAIEKINEVYQEEMEKAIQNLSG